MNPQLHFITLATEDLDAVRAFYRDGLGWKPSLDVAGEIIFFQVAPGLTLGFFDADKFGQDLGLSGPVGAVNGITFAHNVGSRDAVEESARKVVAAGGTVLMEPQEGAFGGVYHAYISDPNGVVWEIAYNPGWRIADDGTVVFG
ncbi:MAG TPA: VOC family protein [Thermomicrobiales bacterium]|nr:VOC family protein [Thermomicrobiales bacterium]